MINHHLKNQFREREKQSTKPTYKRANKLNYSVVIHSQLKRKYEKGDLNIRKKKNYGQMYEERKMNAKIKVFT